MMDDWHKIRRLTSRERLLLVHAAVLIPLISIGLRLLGWQRLMRLLALRGQNATVSQTTEDTVDYALRVAYVTNAAAGRRFFKATCLQRSIVLWWLLRCKGIETQLNLGARKEQGNFQAHAWVEYEGKVLNDRPDVREEFAVFEHG